MYNFPDGLYTDVRTEDVFSTDIVYTIGSVDDRKEKQYNASFIRMFDGNRWYYSVTTSTGQVQEEIDRLAALAEKNHGIDRHRYLKNLQISKGEYLKFADHPVSETAIEEKDSLLKSFFPVINETGPITAWKMIYKDLRKVKEFYSSKGSELVFDSQHCGYALSFQMSDKKERFFKESFQCGENYFSDIPGETETLRRFLDHCVNFMNTAEPVQPGKYPVVLSPKVAGVFAHESFGHKSEADFMLGDEQMKKDWEIGKQIGEDFLSIVDDGNELGIGFTPFDDEGTAASKTYLIKNGKLSGRLHSTATAAEMEENVTGNARAVGFEYEPVVRMTTTYIEPGDIGKKELLSSVSRGIYIDSIRHGSGMSTFTLAPARAFRIENGEIGNPVSVSVVTGNVFRTLQEIEGVSDKLELFSFVGGGCGKMEQFSLPVGFGGPYVKVKSMDVQ
ncbi:MAG: TldD/PmbA family protein [Spirochaetia bacterium]